MIANLRPPADRFAVFEHLPVDQRRGRLKAVSEWLMDWPDNERGNPVSWIQVALDHCPTAQPHRITAIEVEACRTWLVRKGDSVLRTNCRRARIGLDGSNVAWEPDAHCSSRNKCRAPHRRAGGCSLDPSTST